MAAHWVPAQRGLGLGLAFAELSRADGSGLAGEEQAASVADRKAGATVLAPASGRVEAAPPFQAGKAVAALR